MNDLEKIFKALANKNRLRILEAIMKAENECADHNGDKMGPCVTALADEVGLTQPTVSHHLKELCTAGLIETDKRGLRVYCTVGEDALEKIDRFISSLRRTDKDS